MTGTTAASPGRSAGRAIFRGGLLCGVLDISSAVIISIANGGSGNLQVSINGTLQGTFATTGRVVVYGGNSNDDITVDGSVATPQAAITVRDSTHIGRCSTRNIHKTHNTLTGRMGGMVSVEYGDRRSLL